MINNGKSIGEIKVGDAADFTKTVTETDVHLYAGVTGDLNPAQINDTYAKATIYKGRIVHGMLSAGLISAVLGMGLPGAGTIYISQTLDFRHPVRIGDTITAHVEAMEIWTEKNRVKFRTTCTNQDGEVVVDGEAVVMPPLLPKQ